MARKHMWVRCMSLWSIINGHTTPIFLLEFPGKIVLADAGKTGKEIQRQRLCKMLFHISDQIPQIFRYRGVCFFFLGRVPEKIGKDTADTIGSQPVPAGLYGAING